MKYIFLFFCALFLFISCKQSLPVEDSFENNKYTLFNQDSIHVNFPQAVRGKIAVVGYIFTNCPDICPLTTNNMRLVQEKLNKEGVKSVEFVSISFDPEVDTPSVLKKYAELRKLDMGNWTFLTGEPDIIKMLMKDANIVAVVGDSTVIDGKTMFFYVHTDKISLLDREGNVRKNYLGSKADINEIVTDIKTLID